MKVAILDDYQNIASWMADWGALPQGLSVVTFSDRLGDERSLSARLDDFDIVIGMRERTPFGRALLERLPNLKLLITTGMANAAFDMDAATDLGITVCGTATSGGPGTAELTWGLILSLVRRIPAENSALRGGSWQTSIGEGLEGKTLGVIGLGNIGARVARVGLAFEMTVLAWSQNLTPESASNAGVEYATKDRLLSVSDIVTIHLRLSDRTVGLIDARDIEHMKPSAYLINTSRGPIVDESALIRALQQRAIGGAGLDVFDQEPLPPEHPLRGLNNVVMTPHLGYVTVESYRLMFAQAVDNIQSFLNGEPVRVLNREVLDRPVLRRPTPA